MEALKLSVNYSGYYGGNVNEYCLLPIEWNGLYAPELEEGTYASEIYLGEIEGKHSEVYGDLLVEILDLNEMNPMEINELINNACSGEFESAFEEWYGNCVSEMEENEYDELLLKQKSFEEKYSIKFKSEWSIKSSIISNAFEEYLKSKLTHYENITIKSADKEKVIQLLKDNGVEIL